MITSRLAALEYIFQNKSRNILELENKIDESLLREFELIGYIKRGVLNDNNSCQITNFGIRIYKTFCKKPTFIERLLGYYCHLILRY